MEDRAYEISKTLEYDGYQRALASVVHKFFDKKIGFEVSVNEQLLEELHKPGIKKFERRKICARFKDNIWTADLAEMESLSSKNRNVKYLLCVINFFIKNAWINSLKDKKGKTVLNAFKKTVNRSNNKPNESWLYQGREFCNKLMQEWLNNNDILMYLTQNEGKSVIAERFIKTLKVKIYKINNS